MEPIVIRGSVRQAISNLLWTGTLFIGGSCAAVLVRGGWVATMGGAAAIAGAIGLVINLFRLFNRSPRLVLSEEGVIVPKHSQSIIPWSEIEECDMEIKRNNNGIIVYAILVVWGDSLPQPVSVSVEGLELSPAEIKRKVVELGGFGWANRRLVFDCGASM